MAGPSLGTNMHGLADWSTAFPFIDHFRMSRAWYTQSDGVFDTGQAHLLDLDENGWPRAFTVDGSPAPFDRVSSMLFTGGHVLKGTYVLDWQGTGEVTVDFLPQGAILSQEDGRITFRISDDNGLQVSIRETDPLGTGDHIRDIRLYNIDDTDLLDAGEQFAPEFLQKIDGFRALRFMDWMATNNSDIRLWSERRPGDYVREADYGDHAMGASVETMVALANKTRADPWFTLPHGATDDYIRKFASYVKKHLDPGLVARFEFSNEVWNWGFDQAHDAQARASALWGADITGGWMQWYGVRAARMAEIVQDVFGDATGKRALNVFATQSGWQGLESYALDAPDAVAAGLDAPRDAPFHVYAIAPYFGGSLGSDDMAARIDRWVAAGEDGFRAALTYLRRGDAPDSLARIGEQIAYHAGVAESLGLQLEAYEGGQHVVDLEGLFGGVTDPAQTAFFIDLVKRPEFFRLYQDYFEIWRDNGGGLMAHFSDFGAGSRYGSWGIWDSAHAEDSPRAAAVLAFRDQVPAWWGDDRRDYDFDNGRTWVDRDGSDQQRGTRFTDALIGLDGDNRLSGFTGADVLTGRGGDDTLVGGQGHDRLIGRGGDDMLRGGGGRDEIWGGGGDDTILAAASPDLLSGGAGADVFVFDQIRASLTRDPDRITDFEIGRDRIDLSDLGPARWRGDAAFTGRDQAEIRYHHSAEGIVLEQDTDGDGAANLSVILLGLDRFERSDLLM